MILADGLIPVGFFDFSVLNLSELLGLSVQNIADAY
jgi:hypothetical protein